MHPKLIKLPTAKECHFISIYPEQALEAKLSKLINNATFINLIPAQAPQAKLCIMTPWWQYSTCIPFLCSGRYCAVALRPVRSHRLVENVLILDTDPVVTQNKVTPVFINNNNKTKRKTTGKLCHHAVQTNQVEWISCTGILVSSTSVGPVISGIPKNWSD